MESFESYENVSFEEVSGDVEGCNFNGCNFENTVSANFIGCNFENCVFETIATFVRSNLLDCETTEGSVFEESNNDFSEEEISDSEALDIIIGGRK
jgi:uncharacterized protein YjbI with pentapeptide repeats